MDEQRSGIFQSIRFWQGWSVAATAAALFAFIAHVEYPVDGNVPDYVAIVGEAGSEPLWVVNANLADGVIQVRAGTATAPGDDEVYRLWVVRQDDPRNVRARQGRACGPGPRPDFGRQPRCRIRR